METIVQVRAAKIPIIGLIALHYWYVVIRAHQLAEIIENSPETYPYNHCLNSLKRPQK